MPILVNSQPFEPGCYADGSHGLIHTQRICLSLAEDYAGLDLLGQHNDDGNGPQPSEPDWDEDVLTATDALNGVTQGGFWEWVEGDLVLVPTQGG